MVFLDIELASVSEKKLAWPPAHLYWYKYIN